MLEYVFFHRVPYQRFIDFVQEKGLTPRGSEHEDSFEVGLPETLDEGLSEEIETFYDQLMELNQTLFEQELDSNSDNYQAAGVVVNLAGGQTVYADVRPVLLSKLMSVLTPQEFGDLVNAIVDAVENPDERSLCQRMRDEN